MYARLVASALSLVFFFGSLATAQSISKGSQASSDSAQRVNPNTPGNEFLKPVGLLVDRLSKKTATAVLISNCHVLTNRHAVGGIRKLGEDYKGEVEEDITIEVTGNVLEFHVGFNTDKPFELRSKATATVVASGKGGDIDDWAVLRLDQHLGRRYGTAYVLGFSFSAGEPVVTAGYPADKFYPVEDGHVVRSMWMWKQEGLLEESRAYWTANLRVMAGQSGSPVFVRAAGRYVVIGLLRGEFPPRTADGHSTAQIVPLVDAVERLSEAVERYPCT